MLKAHNFPTIMTVFMVVVSILFSGITVHCDPAAAETVMVKNINTQTVPGSIYSSVKGRGLVNVNGTIFFSVNGTELWKSDGTDSGTVMVKSFDGGVGIDSDASVSVNGTLFFSASEEVNVAGLWKSDGTIDGTVSVKKNLYLSPNIVTIGGILYFGAYEGNHRDAELWKSDGTEAGTVMVKDINPNGNSNPGPLTVMDGMLYFFADDGTTGFALWKSDGTEQGTVMLKDLHLSGQDVRPSMTVFNGALYFFAGNGNALELWKSDGTRDGCVAIKTIATVIYQ